MDLTGFQTHPGNSTETPVISFHHRAIVASVLIALTIIGLFGNGLVILSVIVAKKLRTVTNILVVNLAFADLVTCSLQPFLSLGLLSQTGRYPLHEAVCATVAGVMFTCLCSSGSTLVAIAVVRWYVITRSVRAYQGIHTPKKIVTVVVNIWILSVAFMVVPPVLGFGTLGYSKYYGLCSFSDTNSYYFYSVIFQAILLVTALLLNVTFYILILRHVVRHNRQIQNMIGIIEISRSSTLQGCQNEASSVPRGRRPPKIQAINKMEVEITKNLFIVVCVFILCFLVHSVNLVIPGTSIASLYGYIILLANSVVNPIIYGLKHPNFQGVFKNILCCRQLDQG
ncbi:rhodopsin, GQ-coupled-like [Strongylocentrotus purpuratus]|uniref:G-protein coupled receptors family 1 profile domain-containing protein n=1 Tax=Strongylocentrotus purpuratus TaxID=7668 RepID=A0A7M7T4F2_STRPU|nr:rhodopsin, GQ-coupled-like [Strongylocentrotus purpuratus]